MLHYCHPVGFAALTLNFFQSLVVLRSYLSIKCLLQHLFLVIEHLVKLLTKFLIIHLPHLLLLETHGCLLGVSFRQATCFRILLLYKVFEWDGGQEVKAYHLRLAVIFKA